MAEEQTDTAVGTPAGVDYSRIDELLKGGPFGSEDTAAPEPTPARDAAADLEDARSEGASADEDAPTGDGDETSDSEGEEEAGRVNLKEIAERLGVSVKDLYDLEIPMKDGEPPITLGEFKDRAAELMTVEAQQTEFFEQRASFNKEQMTARKEISDILRVLPQQAYTPELVRVSMAVARETAQREAELLESALPEWSDPAVQAQDWKEIKTALAEYGYKGFEVDEIVDHRVKVVLRDYVRLQKLVKSANGSAKEVRRSPGRKNTPRKGNPLREALNRAKQSGASEAVKLSAVEQLIRGG